MNSTSWQPSSFTDVDDGEWQSFDLPRTATGAARKRRPATRAPYERVRPANKGPLSLVFCDFDGVLNDHPSGAYGLKRSQVARLNWITSRYNAQVVVSSWWRWIGLARLRSDLRDAGFTGRVIGRTPWLGADQQWDAYERGTEIQAVLDYLGERVQHIVILDDHDRMGPLLPWLCQTDGHTGLHPDDLQLAAGILATPAPTFYRRDVNQIVDSLTQTGYPSTAARTGRALNGLKAERRQGTA